MWVTDRHNMTLAVKVALNPNLLISLRPYNSHAYNLVLPAPKCTRTFEATRKSAKLPIAISPGYPKTIDRGRSAIYRWLRYQWSAINVSVISATIDSRLIERCLMPFSAEFQLYRGGQCNYPCIPGVLLTNTQHNIPSKPLSAFPLTIVETIDNGSREEWILSQWLSSVLGRNIGRIENRTSDILFSRTGFCTLPNELGATIDRSHCAIGRWVWGMQDRLHRPGCAFYPCFNCLCVRWGMIESELHVWLW